MIRSVAEEGSKCTSVRILQGRGGHHHYPGPGQVRRLPERVEGQPLQRGLLAVSWDWDLSLCGILLGTRFYRWDPAAPGLNYRLAQVVLDIWAFSISLNWILGFDISVRWPPGF